MLPLNRQRHKGEFNGYWKGPNTGGVLNSLSHLRFRVSEIGPVPGDTCPPWQVSLYVRAMTNKVENPCVCFPVWSLSACVPTTAASLCVCMFMCVQLDPVCWTLNMPLAQTDQAPPFKLNQPVVPFLSLFPLTFCPPQLESRKSSCLICIYACPSAAIHGPYHLCPDGDQTGDTRVCWHWRAPPSCHCP